MVHPPRHPRICFPILILVSVFVVCLMSPPVLPQGTPEDAALLTARQLREGRFSDIATSFSAEMAAALPAANLAQIWGNLVATAGPVRDVGNPSTVQLGSTSVVTVPLQFERGSFDLVITVTAGKTAGLFIRPAQTPPPPRTAAAYNNPAAYHDVEITIGAAPMTLPATLSLPQATKKVAAVVLVHGSGPNDRNETIGANRPFQDLAEGLASRGIAVLRYEKRAKVYPQAFAARGRTFTVREEVIEDAVAAIALLRARAEIDPGKVVVIGHSLGATLAPRIAKENPAPAAIVMLAAAARPIPELLIEQTEYLAGLNGTPDATVKAQIATLKAEAERALAAKAGDTGEPILNVPPSYWADLNAYDPVATAATLTLPILALQGGRDYQVTSKDFERFQSSLSGRSNVTLTLLPALNHIFIAGDGPSSPVEYAKPGHVDAAVIEAIIQFIDRLPGS